MKKVITKILTASLIASMTSGISASAAEEIKVTLNGAPIQFDQAPVIQNERTLVPIRAIFEAMGMTVSWDENTRKILAIGSNSVITMEIGTAMLGYGSSADNIEIHPMDVAPCIINDRTFVPVRFIAESTGYNVTWDDSSKTVVITGSSKPVVPTDEEFEIKGSIEFYPNHNDVVDYGKLNDTDCMKEENTEDGYRYDYISTGNDVVNYVYAIKAQGYEMIPDPVQIFGLTVMEYEKDGKIIRISYNKGDKSCSITIK